MDPDNCPAVDWDEIGAVVAMAVDGLQGTSADDGWSSECAWVRSLGSDQPSFRVTVSIAWGGTLRDYRSIPGARALPGLADEAYAFDAGNWIALRSGELVAVVAVTTAVKDVPAPTTPVSTLARLVADSIDGLG